MVARIVWYKIVHVRDFILSLLRLYLVFFRTFIYGFLSPKILKNIVSATLIVFWYFQEASSRQFATKVARIVAQNNKNLQLCNHTNPHIKQNNKRCQELIKQLIHAAAAAWRRQKHCGASSAWWWRGWQQLGGGTAAAATRRWRPRY